MKKKTSKSRICFDFTDVQIFMVQLKIRINHQSNCQKEPYHSKVSICYCQGKLLLLEVSILFATVKHIIA